MRLPSGLFFIVGLALVGCGGGPQPTDGGSPPSDCPLTTSGPTDHSGTIVADETWTAAMGPHTVSSDITIQGGATVTIEPCVTVEVAADVRIRVGTTSGEVGTLTAEATAEEPISFSAMDDTPWNNLYVQYPGTASFANVTFEGAGADTITYDGATLVAHADSERPVKPILKVIDVQIKGSQGYGILMERMASFISGSTGLSISGSGATLPAHPQPVFMDAVALDTLPAGVYSGNAVDEILVNPFHDVEKDMTIADAGVPYRIDGTGSAPTTLTVVRNFDNAAAPVPVLTVDAGVVLKFGTNGALRIGGSSVNARRGGLIVRGTALNAVTFTSAADSPSAGDWRGLVIYNPIGTTIPIAIDYAKIEFAAQGSFCQAYTCAADSSPGDLAGEAAALSVCGGQLDPAGIMRNSTISDSAGWGVLRGWEGLSAGPDFTATAAANIYTNIAYCNQSMRDPAPGTSESCPTSPRPLVPGACTDGGLF